MDSQHFRGTPTSYWLSPSHFLPDQNLEASETDKECIAGQHILHSNDVHHPVPANLARPQHSSAIPAPRLRMHGQPLRAANSEANVDILAVLHLLDIGTIHFPRDRLDLHDANHRVVARSVHHPKAAAAIHRSYHVQTCYQRCQQQVPHWHW